MVLLIPKLISYPSVVDMVLPAGIHDSSLQEVKEVFTFSNRREFLFDGLVEGVRALSLACCRSVYLNGSFVSSKPEPND